MVMDGEVTKTNTKGVLGSWLQPAAATVPSRLDTVPPWYSRQLLSLACGALGATGASVAWLVVVADQTTPKPDLTILHPKKYLGLHQ